jgi:hypothetical protein
VGRVAGGARLPVGAGSAAVLTCLQTIASAGAHRGPGTLNRTVIARLGLDAAPTLPPDVGQLDGPTVGDCAPLLPDRYEDLGLIARGGM